MVDRNELFKTEAFRIMDEAEAKGIPLRLLGGMAIYITSPCTRTDQFAREIYDLDFVVPKKKAYPLEKMLEKIGFKGDHEFNSIHGETRLLFNSDVAELDIFVGGFEQCHSMDLEKLIKISKPTIPLANLLLTKLQIVQINKKDILDILALIYDHEMMSDGNPGEVISLKEVNAVLCDDWGWFTTCMDNLDKIRKFVDDTFQGADHEKLSSRIEKLQSSAQEGKKSLKWTVRSKVGRKIQWYELPEEK